MAHFRDVYRDCVAVIRELSQAELTCQQSADIFACAIEHADEMEVNQGVLQHCADDHLELVLRTLVSQGLWCAVGKTLKKCGNEQLLRWATEEATKRADGNEIAQYILPHCSDDQLDSVLVEAVTRGHWQVVDKIVKRRVRTEQNKQYWIDARWAEEEIWKDQILPLCPRHTLDSVLTELVTRSMWSGVWVVLEQGSASEAKRIWAIKEVGQRADDVSLYCIASVCPRDQLCWLLFKAVKRGFTRVADWVLRRFEWSLHLTTVVRSYLKEKTERKGKNIEQHDIFSEAVKDSLLEILNEITEYLQSMNKSKYATCFQNELISQSKLKEWVWRLEQRGLSASLSMFQFKALITRFYKLWLDGISDTTLCVVLCSLPIAIDIQNCILKSQLEMLSLEFINESDLSRVWQCMRYADLSYVWEQVGRDLFQAAVGQRQWGAVMQWADHSLYDDQRGWALGEAFKEKQWDALLLLADHGLTKSELMGVHYRLARYGDWDTILQMFERGADISDVREMLETAVRRSKAKRSQVPERAEDEQRCQSIKRLAKRIAASRISFEKITKRCDWRSVLHRIMHNPDEQEFCLALKTAMEKKAWHVVQQLVKLEMDAAQRDSLFPEMVRRRQWGVCRELLEQCVRIDLCLAALPELMEANQWLLVAKVMEYDVGDELRYQVMQSAMDKRAGSVVWHCISLMQKRLTRAERKALFQKSMAQEVWQAVKALIEETDQTAVSQRDVALQKAIEQHRWDAVDHCLRHKADINKRDDYNETALNRAARRGDWKQVEQIVCRGGDQSILDRRGYSVLQRALMLDWNRRRCKQNVIKVLIQFHGNVNETRWADDDGDFTYTETSKDTDLTDVFTYTETSKDTDLTEDFLCTETGEESEPIEDFGETTPLDRMIDLNMGELIDETLFWGCEVHNGFGTLGETALHAACASGCFKTLYYLVARGVDPLQVTMFGDSVLLFATRYGKRMVAECIKLGFSTHQPCIDRAFERPEFDIRDDDYSTHISSPMEYAIRHNLPVIAHMLYESGACSYRELFRLYSFLRDADFQTLCGSYGGCKFDREFGYMDYSETDIIQENVEEALPYLKRVATNPRSLMSMCRHVISHCLDVRGKRHINVQQLSLKADKKDYVMFTDLTDPDYGKDITW